MLTLLTTSLVLNGQTSSCELIKSRVPQGSALAPLPILFDMYKLLSSPILFDKHK